MTPAPRRPAPALRHPALTAALVPLALAGLLSAACPQRPLALTILHTNDVHARYLPIDRYGGACRDDADPETCFGGVARRATMIGRIRGEEDHVLLLDAGDQFQGTLFYSRFKGMVAAETMNHLRYDAMVVGNHELDDGPQVLARFAAAIRFPLLATNVDASGVPELAAHLAKSTVVEIEGRRIGFVGFVTEEVPQLSSPGPDLRFLPIEETVSAEVARLEREGVDIVIALSHAGFLRDRRVGESVPGIDVIVGGHTNTLLSNTAPDAEGPYPCVVTSPRGEPVLVVSDFAYGKYLGRLDVVFDGRGVATGWQGDPILLDVEVAQDPETLALIEPFAQELRAFAAEPVGSAAVLLDGRESSCRFGECNLGNLIADALLEEGRARGGAQVALQNGGGVRSSISAGPITIGQVLEVLPFGNTVSTFGLRGSDLLAVLEHGVGVVEDPDNDGTGRFLQVAGLRYAFSRSAPAGERIRNVEVLESEQPTAEGEPDWRPLDPERVYRVVTNNFSRGGGDGFEVLRDRAIDPYDQGRVVADVLVDHLRANDPVNPQLEGRIREIP
ncbi:MAG TPA: bifunctional metallophosphatase/5'-nucleotidase [Thermoanaerobaculia bacterium]|nr:bifunctional metallophosphatase/5'-nucleotidase [Thermoanaerobaculia bacterium]